MYPSRPPAMIPAQPDSLDILPGAVKGAGAWTGGFWMN
jgi:hypothetical protein